jgi:23S rRNA (guanosine2251-2'-O)-methyltransferase
MDKISRVNPLCEALRVSPRRVQKLLIQKDSGHHGIGELIRLAKSAHVPYSFVPKATLDRLSPGHQGVTAMLAAKEFASLEDILASTANPFLVLLDEVEDPQNLGAIVRSAAGAGADGILLPERRSAGLTEAVQTVAAGALELVPVARVPNLARAMDDLRERGIWLVGAEGGSPDPWYEFDYSGPVGLAFGSEGRGLRPLIRKKCDKILSIPLAGGLGSLNVAAAAAVFLFEVARQRSRTARPSARDGRIEPGKE